MPMPLKINHAILHVFDFVSCVNVFAQEELDLSNKSAKNFVARHVRKAAGNLDNMHGSFSDDSMFAEELRRYFRGERDFTDLSCQIADYLATELGRMEKSVSTDLLVVDFEDEPKKAPADAAETADGADAAVHLDGVSKRCFALLLLESKQAYMHEVGCGDSGQRNDIVRHYAVLPNPSQKVASYAVIDLRTLAVEFQDKKRTIAGEERYLIPEGLLQCSMEASPKEAFSAVTELVEEVAQEYGANVGEAVAKAKSYASENAQESDDLDLALLAEDVFEDNPQACERFDEAASARELPEHMPLERKAVRRVAKTHKIRTDTGIEITFPAEYSKTSEYITFTSEADGRISIQLKNINHIENR
jgi:nucleoid-associated protein YejK